MDNDKCGQPFLNIDGNQHEHCMLHAKVAGTWTSSYSFVGFFLLSLPTENQGSSMWFEPFMGFFLFRNGLYLHKELFFALSRFDSVELG